MTVTAVARHLAWLGPRRSPSRVVTTHVSFIKTGIRCFSSTTRLRCCARSQLSIAACGRGRRRALSMAVIRHTGHRRAVIRCLFATATRVCKRDRAVCRRRVSVASSGRGSAAGVSNTLNVVSIMTGMCRVVRLARSGAVVRTPVVAVTVVVVRGPARIVDVYRVVNRDTGATIVVAIIMMAVVGVTPITCMVYVQVIRRPADTESGRYAPEIAG